MKASRPLRRVLLLLSFASLPAAADVVFPVFNQSTLSRGFALPVLGADRVLLPGQDTWRYQLDWSNEFVVDQAPQGVKAPNETVVLQGETMRYALAWQYGVFPGFDAGIEVPLLYASGGILDPVIQIWHKAFGLPDGGREYAPNNRYLFQYVRDGQVVLNQTQGAVDLGDVELNAGWQLFDNVALRGMVKLPTGSVSKLTGGNPGGALWLDYDPFAGSRRWFGFLSAGASMNGNNDEIPGLQRQFLGLAGAGAGWRAWPHTSFMAQLYFHTPLYHGSEIDAIEHVGLQFAFGGRYDFNRHLLMNLGAQEDLVVDSSPDISFHLSFVLH
jgi:hypothetical protein